MHQRQYVANTSVNFSDFRFFVKPGDMCRHHEDTGDFIVFRNGNLLAKLKISVMALRSMMTTETQFFTEVKAPVKSESLPTLTIIDEPEEEIVIINETSPAPLDVIDAEEEIEEDSEEVESTLEDGSVVTRKKRKKK